MKLNADRVRIVETPAGFITEVLVPGTTVWVDFKMQPRIDATGAHEELEWYAQVSGQDLAHLFIAWDEATLALLKATQERACTEDFCFICSRPTNHWGEHSDEQLLAWAEAHPVRGTCAQVLSVEFEATPADAQGKADAITATLHGLGYTTYRPLHRSRIAYQDGTALYVYETNVPAQATQAAIFAVLVEQGIVEVLQDVICR